MKKNTVTWPVHLLGLVILLFAFQNSSHADKCIKLVANKYCLGGSFGEALKTNKNRARFIQESYKLDGVMIDQISFMDTNVLDMAKVAVALDGLHGKIVAIKFIPIFDGDDDNGYVKTVKTVRDKYCVDVSVLLRKEKSLTCDGGNFLVLIGITGFEREGKLFETPFFGYSAPQLILNKIDRGY